MRPLKNVTLLIAAALVLIVPDLGFCAREKMEELVPIIQLVRDGKAKPSPDFRNIIDEKGNIVAKQTALPVEKKDKPFAGAPDGAKDAASGQQKVLTCSTKCAITTRKCYADDSGYIFCMNICEKELLICE